MAGHLGCLLNDVEWRRLGPFLWAGAGELGPIGTVERGHRFAAVDISGAVVGRCRRLEEAQELLQHLAEDRDPAAAVTARTGRLLDAV